MVAELREPDAKGGVKATWPVKWDSTDPIWDSCRLFGTEAPSARATLTLSFFDKDERLLEGDDDFIGRAEVRVGELCAGSPLQLPIVLGKGLKPTKAGAPYCVVQAEAAGDNVAATKVVYLVRHGESVWNKAQHDKDVVAMLSDVDHPLNAEGRAQAEGLQAGVGGGGEAAAAVLRADAVWASPLTRAVQTCLIGLQPLLLPEGGPARTVLLNPNLREKRNMGGKDSSGKWTGEAIREGVHGALTTLYEDAPGSVERLAAVPLELAHVQNKWWLGSKESEAHVVERIAELLAQVRFCPHSSLVLVGTPARVELAIS